MCVEKVMRVEGGRKKVTHGFPHVSRAFLCTPGILVITYHVSENLLFDTGRSHDHVLMIASSLDSLDSTNLSQKKMELHIPPCTGMLGIQY